MTSTTATTAPMRAALPRRLTSRRTAWILAATATVAVASTAAAVSLGPSETPRPAGAQPRPRRSSARTQGEPRTGAGRPRLDGRRLRVRGQVPGAPGLSLAAAAGATGPTCSRTPSRSSWRTARAGRSRTPRAAAGAGVVAGR